MSRMISLISERLLTQCSWLHRHPSSAFVWLQEMETATTEVPKGRKHQVSGKPSLPVITQSNKCIWRDNICSGFAAQQAKKRYHYKTEAVTDGVAAKNPPNTTFAFS